MFRVKTFQQPHSHKLIFVFSAMGTKIWLYRFFVWRMNRRGYNVIIYDYNNEFVLNPTIEGWKDFFNDIISDAQIRLEEYKESGLTSFYSYGVSMGTLIANKFARDTPEISHVILNLTYGDVAKNIWTCKLVENTKRAYISQKISEEELRRNIKYMDPVASSSELYGKKVKLQLARRDKILVYEQTKETLFAFRQAKIDLIYQESKHFGHFVNGVKNLLDIKQIDKFYQNDI